MYPFFPPEEEIFSVIQMISIAASVLSGFFDIILLPFRMLPPFCGLLFISLVSGLGMIFVFSRVSNQKKISRLRKRMGGEVLGILLHVSSPGTVIRFAWRLICSNTLYLAYILKPLLVIAVPFMLVWGQLDARYSTEGMKKDLPITVTVQYGNGLPARENLDIKTTGVELIPPVVMVDTLDEASFRMLPESDNLRSLEIGGTVIRVGRTGNWSGCRILRGFDSGGSLKRLFCPWIGRINRTEEGPGSGSYSLPDVRYGVLGGYWSWIAVFLVFSTLSAIVGARVFKVKI